MKTSRRTILRALLIFILLFLPIGLGIEYLSIFAAANNRLAVNTGGEIAVYHRARFETITPPNTMAFTMAWSPDGQKIAVIYKDVSQEPLKSGALGEINIGLINVRTHEFESLYSFDSGMKSYFLAFTLDLVWSPDGRQILFERISPKQERRLYGLAPVM